MRPQVTRMVISTQKPRRKPQEGDRKVVRGVEYVRRQVICRDAVGRAQGYAVRNGRPVFEWYRVDGQ